VNATIASFSSPAVSLDLAVVSLDLRE